jgi:hypothetical protein
MMPGDLARNRVERTLMALRHHEPRPDSAERLRTLCHSRLASQRQARPIIASVLTSRGRMLAETALAGALGLIYLADVVRRALWLYGF